MPSHKAFSRALATAEGPLSIHSLMRFLERQATDRSLVDILEQHGFGFYSRLHRPWGWSLAVHCRPEGNPRGLLSLPGVLGEAARLQTVIPNLSKLPVSRIDWAIIYGSEVDWLTRYGLMVGTGPPGYCMGARQMAHRGTRSFDSQHGSRGHAARDH